MYKVIALIGKAGSGKDTFLHEAIDSTFMLNEIISCTTRPPRDNEIEGKNYYFLSKQDFLDNVKNNKMLEWTEFNDWFYGTPLFALDENKINIGVFNPAGIKALKNREDVNLKVFLIETSDKQRLIR